VIVGTTGPGSNAHDVPLLLKEFAGLNAKLIPGYAANADIRLALERKEVDSWTSMATTIRLASEQGASCVRWCDQAARRCPASIICQSMKT